MYLPYHGSAQPGLCGGQDGGFSVVEADAVTDKLNINSAVTPSDEMSFFILTTPFTRYK